MAQNYYIYEHDGKITILPWDYNLAWGGFQSGDTSSVINFPIDTPLSGVEMEDRPLIEKLFANTEYLNRYHTYLQELMDEYFADGKFEEKVNTLNTLISDYVKNDKTAFCTYEEYEKAVSSLITLGNLRAESIQSQLDGTIPSTTEGQKANSNLLISAGDLSLSDLGSMMGDGKRNENNMPNRNDMTGSEFDFTNQSSPGTENDGTNQNPPDMSFPRNTERFREGNSNRNTENSVNGFKLSGASGINGLIIIVVSIVMLIAAMIFTIKTKKSY